MFNKINKENAIQFFVFIFFAMTFAIRAGNGYGAFPLVLIALFSIPSLYRYFKKHPLTGIEKSILAALILFSLLPMLSIFAEGLSSRAYDKPVRYLLGAITFLLLLRYKVNLLTIAIGVWLGAIFAGCNALYDVFYLHMGRAGGRFTIVIEFGDMSLLLTSFVLLFYRQLQKKIPQLFIIISILLGLTAVILSQSRGGWIFVPFLLIIVISHYRHIFCLFNKKQWAITILLLVSILAAGTYSAGDMIKHRISQAENNIVLYQKGKSLTSVGLRFELWKGAIQTIKNNPFLGGGNQGVITGKQQLIDQKKINLPKAFIQGVSAHNQFLDTWARYGVVTFLALMGIFLIPLFYFFTQRNKGDANTRSASYCGITLCSGYLFFALTESIFTINATVMFYAFSLPMLYSCAKTRVNKP